MSEVILVSKSCSSAPPVPFAGQNLLRTSGFRYDGRKMESATLMCEQLQVWLTPTATRDTHVSSEGSCSFLRCVVSKNPGQELHASRHRRMTLKAVVVGCIRAACDHEADRILSGKDVLEHPSPEEMRDARPQLWATRRSPPAAA